MSNKFNKLIIDSLDYFDINQYQNNEIIEKIKNNKYDIEMYRNQHIIILDNGSKYKCEAIGCFDIDINLWVWSWAFPSSAYDTNRIVKLLNYGINISINDSNIQSIIKDGRIDNDQMLYLRGILITSRILIKYKTTIDILLALAAYICKMDKIVCIKSAKQNTNQLIYLNLIYINEEN